MPHSSSNTRAAVLNGQETKVLRAQATSALGVAVGVLGVSIALTLLSMTSKQYLLAKFGVDGNIAGIFFFSVGCALSIVMYVHRSFTATQDIGNDVKSRLREFAEAIDDTVDCRFLGIGSDTMARVLPRIKNAQRVRNTFVLFDVPERELPWACYNPQQIKGFQSAISNFLLNGAANPDAVADWTDIVSQDVVTSSHLEWLKFLTNLDTVAAGHPATKDFPPETRKQYADAARASYKIHRLKATYPIINFMLIEYGHDYDATEHNAEVIFGWGHHAKDKGGRVFISRHHELIQSFERFWEVLESDSVPFDPPASVAPADITGLWFRVAYRAPEGWHAEAGIPPNSSIYDIAFSKIGISEARKLTVSGTRYDSVSFAPQRDFASLAADLEGPGHANQWTLWFATSVNPDKLFIAGSYTFVRPTEESTKVIRFYGEFLNVEATPRPESGVHDLHKIVLYGRKIERTWPAASLLPDDPLDIPPDLLTRTKLLQECLEEWKNSEEATWHHPKPPSPASPLTRQATA
jgi:hypothetical protein